MNGYQGLGKISLVAVVTLALAALLTGSAAAQVDSYLDRVVHPFTFDDDNGTCVYYEDRDVGPTRNCDPVNLIFPERTWMEVRDLLLADDWSLSGGGSDQWLHYDDAVRHVQDEQLYKPGTIFGPRYHIRLWQAPPGGTMVTFAAVHHEDFFHNIDMDWDDAEVAVANALCGASCEQVWMSTQSTIQGDDEEWRSWQNDALATVIPAPGTADDPPDVTIVGPAADSTVAGVTPVQIRATDDNDTAGELVVQWRIDGGGWQPATYIPASGYYEDSWDTTAVADGSHLFQARATDSASNTIEVSHTVVVDNPSQPALTLHVGDLDGLSVVKRTWRAELTITIHDNNETPFADADVNVAWSGDTTGATTCITESDGRCTVATGEMPKKSTDHVIFNVTGVDHASLAYDASLNHDPDGDSSGTVTRVNQDGSVVDPGEPQPSAPVASFNFSCQQLTCTFDGNGSYDPDGGAIVTYDWNFGDGVTVPDGGANINHTYTGAGSWQVTMTVIDDESEASNETQTVTVSEGGTISLMAVGYKVKAIQRVDLSWSGVSGSSIDIYRDGDSIAPSWSSSVMPFMDDLQQKRGGPYAYQICEAGSTVDCSDIVMVEF